MSGRRPSWTERFAVAGVFAACWLAIIASFAAVIGVTGLIGGGVTR